MMNGALPLKNMKKTIPNPEYDKARYSLGWLAIGKIGPQPEPPPKSNHKPPLGLSNEAWNAWMKSYAIYPTIEVDEP